MNVNATPAALRAPAARDTDQQLRQMCRELEAVFLNLMLQAMRSVELDGGLLEKSAGEETFTSLDEAAARTRSTIWFARVLSVALRSRGSVAGLKGRTTTRAGSGRR